MAIEKVDKINYYELDWFVPTESNDKVYIALKGNIRSKTSLNIMANGVGYEWMEEENSTIKKISEKEFLGKAREDNIVYFFDDKDNYNELLAYPKNLQRSIDLELYREGYKPHNRISLKDKIKIVKSNAEVKRQFRKIEKSFSKER